MAPLALGALGSALAMLLFVTLAHEMAAGATRRLDVGVLHFLAAQRVAWVFHLMREVTTLSNPWVQSALTWAVMAWLAVRRRFWPDGLSLFLAAVGGGALVDALKRLFHRPRPDVLFDRLGYSFPSGHTFFAVVIYGMFAYLAGRRAPARLRPWIWSAAVVGVALVGFSRMYLGEHFPSDVAAGLAVGLPWLWGCVMLAERLRRPVPRPLQPASSPSESPTGAQS